MNEQKISLNCIHFFTYNFEIHRTWKEKKLRFWVFIHVSIIHEEYSSFYNLPPPLQSLSLCYWSNIVQHNRKCIPVGTSCVLYKQNILIIHPSRLNCSLDLVTNKILWVLNRTLNLQGVAYHSFSFLRFAFLSLGLLLYNKLLCFTAFRHLCTLLLCQSKMFTVRLYQINVDIIHIQN